MYLKIVMGERGAQIGGQRRPRLAIGVVAALVGET